MQPGVSSLHGFHFHMALFFFYLFIIYRLGTLWTLSNVSLAYCFTNRYYQAREKFMSLKKGTRAEVVTELEEVNYLLVDIFVYTNANL